MHRPYETNHKALFIGANALRTILQQHSLDRNNGKRNRNLYNDLMQKYKELRSV